MNTIERAKVIARLYAEVLDLPNTDCAKGTQSSIQTLMTSPAMRQRSPARLPSQSGVRHTRVPMQTWPCGQPLRWAGLKGLHAISCLHSRVQIVPASFGASRLAVQEKAGQT